MPPLNPMKLNEDDLWSKILKNGKIRTVRNVIYAVQVSITLLVVHVLSLGPYDL